MGLQTRKELLGHLRERYKLASWNGRRKILDGLVATTGYRRKYAISLLNKEETKLIIVGNEKRLTQKKYGEIMREVFLTLWYATNKICSKRLVPFIPDLLSVFERYGYISASTEVRHHY